MWIRLTYQTHEDEEWVYGKEWFLHGLENGELEFSTEWMRLKPSLPVKSVIKLYQAARSAKST